MFKIDIAIVSLQNLFWKIFFGLKLHLLQSVVQYYIMKKKLNSIISGEERICVEKNIVSLFLHVKPSYGPWCSKVKISNWYNFEVVFIIKEKFHILFLVHIFVVTCKSLKHCVKWNSRYLESDFRQVFFSLWS